MAGSQGSGRTRWGRFLGFLGLGLAGALVVLTCVAQGALAASFSVAGTDFKVSAAKLEGEGFVQFGGVDSAADAAHPVVVSGFQHAVLDDFCQSVVMRGIPLVGDVTLRMTSGGPGGMVATDIVLGVADLSGDLTLEGVEIGVDAAHVTKGPAEVRGQPGGFGQQADRATVVGLRQTAWSASAYTLRLRSLDLDLGTDTEECF